jgi:WD40 repeat protein
VADMGRARLNGQSGGGFPTGWKDELLAQIVNSTILKGDPVVTCKYGSFDTVADAVPSPNQYSSQSLGITGMTVNNDGSLVAIGSYYSTVYNLKVFSVNKDTDVFTEIYSESSGFLSPIQALSFSPDGKFLAINSANGGSPFLLIYQISGQTFTKLANPSLLPTNGVMSLCFSTDSQYLVCGQTGNTTSLTATIYKISGSTFTKITFNVNLGPCRSCDFSPDMNYMVLGIYAKTMPYIYKRNGDTFTKLYGDVSGTGYVYESVKFSPDGIYLAYTTEGTSKLIIMKRSGDTFTLLETKDSDIGGNARFCDFSPDGTFLAVTCFDSPFLVVYKRVGDTFTKLNNLAIYPNNTNSGVTQDSIVVFSKDGKYLFVSSVNKVVVGEGTRLLIYRTNAKDIVQKITSFEDTPIGWLPFPRHKIGIAKEGGSVGSTIKINLFPRLYNL